MNDVYVIIDLFGRVLARTTAASAADADRTYREAQRQRRAPMEAYQIMTRREWIRWQTEQDYSDQAQYLPRDGDEETYTR